MDIVRLGGTVHKVERRDPANQSVRLACGLEVPETSTSPPVGSVPPCRLCFSCRSDTSQPAVLSVLDRYDAFCREVLATLAERMRKYADPQRPFVNFELAAKAVGRTPEEMLLAFAAKHWAAVVHEVRQAAAEGRRVDAERIRDSLRDIAGYMAILSVIIEP